MIIIQMEYPFFFHYKVRSTLYTSLWDIPLRDSGKQNTDKSDKQNAEEGSSRMQSGTDNTMLKWAWLMQFNSSLRQTQEKELF